MKQYLCYLGHFMFNQLYSIIDIGDPSLLKIYITPIDVYQNKKCEESYSAYAKPSANNTADTTLFLHYDNKVDYLVLSNMYKDKNIKNIILLNPYHDKNVYAAKNDSNINIFAINDKESCAEILSILLNWEAERNGIIENENAKEMKKSIARNVPIVSLDNGEFTGKVSRDTAIHVKLKEVFSKDKNMIDKLKNYAVKYENVQHKIKIILAGKVERVFYILFSLIISCCFILIFLCIKLYLGLCKKDPVCTLSEINNCPIKKYESCSKQFDTCLICMEVFRGTENVRELLCKHYYHKGCIDPWLKCKSARCPYCRTLMKQSV